MTQQASAAIWRPRSAVQRWLDVAGRLGHPTGECLVVGDEEMDMAGARAGCPTFLVQSASTRLNADTPEPTYRGTLEDVVALLE